MFILQQNIEYLLSGSIVFPKEKNNTFQQIDIYPDCFQFKINLPQIHHFGFL